MKPCEQKRRQAFYERCNAFVGPAATQTMLSAMYFAGIPLDKPGVMVTWAVSHLRVYHKQLSVEIQVRPGSSTVNLLYEGRVHMIKEMEDISTIVKK